MYQRKYWKGRSISVLVINKLTSSMKRLDKLKQKVLVGIWIERSRAKKKAKTYSS